MLFTLIALPFVLVVFIVCISFVLLYRMRNRSVNVVDADERNTSVIHDDCQDTVRPFPSAHLREKRVHDTEDDANYQSNYRDSRRTSVCEIVKRGEDTTFLLARHPVRYAPSAVPISLSSAVSSPCTKYQTVACASDCTSRDTRVCEDGAIVMSNSSSNISTNARATATLRTSVASLHALVDKIRGDTTVDLPSTEESPQSSSNTYESEPSAPADMHSSIRCESATHLGVLGRVIEKAKHVDGSACNEPDTGAAVQSSAAPVVHVACHAPPTAEQLRHGADGYVSNDSVIASPDKNYLCDDLVFEDDVHYANAAEGGWYVASGSPCCDAVFTSSVV